MTAEELFEEVHAKAQEMGMVSKNQGHQIVNPKGNTIVRKNLQGNAFTDGTAYWGFLNPEEETSGQYSDFSFVVFPNDSDVKTCVVCLGVGSSGFRNDYHLAALPGIRRMFLKLKGQNTFFKASFNDIESKSTDLINEIHTSHSELEKVIKKYRTLLPASCIVNLQEGNGVKIIYAWLATYAKIRSWATNKDKRKAIEKALPKISGSEGHKEENDITDLLEKRKYIVLQGAPGTGKTYTALNIAKGYDQTFFEQFHAETTFSDFVYGIEPNISKDMSQPQFKAKKGILYQAVEYAIDHKNEKVLLIIDEINRANLSNVLGPVFYLFEYQTGMRKVEISVGDMKLTQLPNNLYVIATMNTADRSLAVVDFALRRRFAWYTLRPHEITPGPGVGKEFMKETYIKFADIFFLYATDDELNLQPGQSYFIVGTNKPAEEMKERMIYELLPLMKEYLTKGYLLKAKDAFCDLFLKETGKLMYE